MSITSDKELKVAKKIIAFVGILFLAGGIAFAQKNALTVDVGPTIIGVAVGQLGSIVGDSDINTSGFGIGLQYERHILEKLSVAGRFAYLGAGLGVKDDGTGARLSMDITSYSIEGHVRLYPTGSAFFLDGMLGYGNITTTLDGSVKVGGSQRPVAHFSPSRNYFKLGGKIGWRNCFGRQGGFTFEPSLGYSYGIGLGESVEKQLAGIVGGDAGDFDDVFKYVENIVFIGGPKISLAFGWSF